MADQFSSVDNSGLLKSVYAGSDDPKESALSEALKIKRQKAAEKQKLEFDPKAYADNL